MYCFYIADNVNLESLLHTTNDENYIVDGNTRSIATAMIDTGNDLINNVLFIYIKIFFIITCSIKKTFFVSYLKHSFLYQDY